jgi:NAD(P)-dependent dehydrogenase (short-subunit alcohol dehydrogenase family)
MRKVAMITGGASGIGFGVSECLAKEGYDLAICGRRDEAAVTSSIDGLRGHGSDVRYETVDVSDAEMRRTFVERTRSHFGRLDILVNNAGVAPKERRDILDATEESFETVLGINLRGPYFLMQAVAPWMIEQHRADPSFTGTIVNMTSISATVASTNRGEYCVSKAGLAMASKLWAVRLAEFGINVYDVRPGVIRSDMTSGVEEKYDRLIEQGLIPQERWGEPADVGRVVAMLARGDMGYSTGQVLMVDGGMTLDRL